MHVLFLIKFSYAFAQLGRAKGREFFFLLADKESIIVFAEKSIKNLITEILEKDYSDWFDEV
jgi:hypothetical protein